MPKSAPQIVWSEENTCYTLHNNASLQAVFSNADESAWLTWLAEQAVFSFEGQSGHLYVVKEARARGTGYWYAYRTRGQRTRKRYLGKTNAVTLVRLEEVAATLAHENAPLTQTVAGPPNEPNQSKVAGRDDDEHGLSTRGYARSGDGWSGGLEATGVPVAEVPLSATPPSSVDIVLLPKLAPPRLPPTLVARERLLEQLDQALTHELTLLSASAGFGKTTLLSAWVVQTRGFDRKAWLSLEEQDNDPTRFWSYVIAALRTVEPGCGATALSMLQAPQPPALITMLTTLINDLAVGQQEIVLVLDDSHILTHPAILETLAFLLAHLPARLHLVLAGRIDPPLTLPRLRAGGSVVELRDRDLRFTHTEAAHFLTQSMALPLAEGEVTLLEQRTEGWIAGLQLAVLAMRAHEDHSTFVRQLSGSQRYILDYIQEEVLDRQVVEIQDFLLYTAVLTRLNASLCQAVTVGASVQASQAMLARLEKAQLFLVALDEERHWYRLHSLFRDVLQARLQTISPDLVPVLHQRAAHWYAQQGDTFEAVEHALTGADYAFAADLMERSAVQMWSDGQGELLSNWLRRLPDAFLLTHGHLVLTGFLYLLNHTFYAPAEQWNAAVKNVEQTIAHMEQLLEHQKVVALSEAHLLHKRIALLRGWIATRDLYGQTNIEQKRRHTVQMQELAREDDRVWKMIPFFNLLSWEANRADFLPMFFALKQQAEVERHDYEAVRVMAWICEVYEQAGQLHQAEQLYREGLQRLQRLGKARAMFGYFHLYLAGLHWEWNRLEEAQSHLTTAMQFAKTWQHVDIQIKGSYLLFQILLATGKHIEAAQALTEAEQCIPQSWEDVQSYWTIIMHGQFWLAQSHVAEAADWATHMAAHLPPIDFYYRYSGYFITLVRVYFALQRNSEACQLLAETLSQVERSQRRWDAVPLLALQVVAHYHSGEMCQARPVAAHLLTLTEAEGVIRVYLDAGAPMKQVLQSLLDTASTPPEHDGAQVVPLASIRTLLAAFEQQERQVPHSEQAATLPLQAACSSLLSPLTARELEVLPLVAQGKTNQEIADQLVVSLATAKKHVANILGKLGAENRVQAIARAREHELL